MLNDFAFRFIALSENDLKLIYLGLFVAGFLAVPLTGAAPKFSVGRIRYLFAVAIVTCLIGLVPAMWFLAPAAIIDGLLAPLVLANLAATAVGGFLYGLSAQARARHAYGRATPMWMAVVPIANLVLHFKAPLEKGASPGRARIALNAALVALGLALFVSGQVLVSVIDIAIDRQADGLARSTKYQAARAAGIIDAVGLESYLDLEAGQVRPERVDDVSVLVSATARGRDLIFAYEIDVPHDRINEAIRAEVIDRTCDTPAAAPVFEAGGNWVYAYTNASGADMGEVRVNADVCSESEGIAQRGGDRLEKAEATPVPADSEPRATTTSPRLDFDRLVEELGGDVRIETPESRRRAFEKMVSESPMAPSYDAIRSYFPDDYAAMMDDLTSMIETSSNGMQAFALSHELGARIRRKHADSLSSAPDELLVSMLAAHSQALRRMQGLDEALCARYVVSGASDPSDFTDGMLAAVSEAAAVMYRAMYVGGTIGEAHGAATDADFARAMDYAVEFHLAEGDLPLILQPDSSNPQTCGATRRFLDAIATNDRTGAARVRAETAGVLAGQ